MCCFACIPNRPFSSFVPISLFLCLSDSKQKQISAFFSLLFIFRSLCSQRDERARDYQQCVMLVARHSKWKLHTQTHSHKNTQQNFNCYSKPISLDGYLFDLSDGCRSDPLRIPFASFWSLAADMCISKRKPIPICVGFIIIFCMKSNNLIPSVVFFVGSTRGHRLIMSGISIEFCWALLLWWFLSVFFYYSCTRNYAFLFGKSLNFFKRRDQTNNQRTREKKKPSK